VHKIIAVLTLTSVMLGSVAVNAGAQQNGIVIENNGVSESSSAAGADNVQISRAPGNSSSTDGAGISNEAGYLVKEEKNRERKDRGNRNNTEELAAAPAEEPVAAPADETYDAYAEGGEWFDPAAAPQEVPAESTEQSNLPIQLPNTGSGNSAPLPLDTAVAGLLVVLAGGAVLSRRRLA